jgi:hypothetical protein
VSRYDKILADARPGRGRQLQQLGGALHFRVTRDDGFDHASGDSKKACGFTVGSGATSLLVALLGLALIACGGRRKFRV